jgi:hypothetical protein
LGKKDDDRRVEEDREEGGTWSLDKLQQMRDPRGRGKCIRVPVGGEIESITIAREELLTLVGDTHENYSFPFFPFDID